VSQPRRLLLNLALAALTLLWGTTWAAIRIGLEGVPPFTGAAVRFVLGSAVLLALAPLFHVSFGRRPHEVRVWLANGIFLFIGSYGAVYWSEQWVPSGIAAVLFATFPLFVALLAHFLVPGERIRPKTIGGLGLGLAGVALIHSEDFGSITDRHTAVATLVFMISPVSAALANVLVKRWGREVHPVSTTAVPMMIGAVGLGTGAIAFERSAPMRWDALSIGIVIYLAVFGTVVTFLLYFWAMKHLPVTRVSLIAYLTPIVAVAIGTLFLDEPLTWRIALGAAGIIGGVAIAGGRRPRGGPVRSPALSSRPGADGPPSRSPRSP
jgi:drug/metabolite transporter (DMT)-like permease